MYFLTVANNFVVEATPCQTVTAKTGIRNNKQPPKRNAQQEIEPYQKAVCPNNEDEKYGLEASRDPTKTTKSETQVCMKDNIVFQKGKATATQMASPDETDQPNDDLDSASIPDHSRVKEGVGLKESSSTKDQTSTSSGLSDEHISVPFPFKFVFALCFRNKIIVVGVLQEECLLN